MSLPARPRDALAVFERLAHWGEVSVCEAEELEAVPWVSLFENAGALQVVRDDCDRPVAWHLTPGFVHLLECDAQQLGRRLCFAVPDYRAYLLGILAEGLADAGRAGMTAELEEWTRAELAALVPELNAFLGKLESGKRLVDLTPTELESRMADLPERAMEFAGWDAFALGQIARPKVLFEFALRRFASLGGLPIVDKTAAVLRMLPLNREDGFDRASASLPHGWNTQRFGVRSGVSVVDPHGNRLFDNDAPHTDALVEHLRDALVEHPFYAAVVHLAICAWRSPTSTMEPVELYLPDAGNLHDASVLVGSRGAGRVADLLGDLVRAQGFAPFGLVNGRVTDELMDNLFLNLLELRVLRHQDEVLILDEDFQSSLMSARLRTVFRPGKELQRRLVDELVTRTTIREGGAS